MELQRKIFNSARDGYLERLQFYLRNKSPEEVLHLVSTLTDDSTPLIVACKEGWLHIASYLINNCHADVEQMGLVSFDQRNVDKVTPLWCAAAAGRLNVVMCLLRNGASINSVTNTNSTPLHAACINNHYEVARYLVWHGANMDISNNLGHTCLMISCLNGNYDLAFLLINNGADKNKRCNKGRTALHYCAGAGNFEILKLLLEYRAAIVTDFDGETPLLTAALRGDVEFVECCIREFYFTRKDKINALELIGADFINRHGNLNTALSYWIQAMNMRYQDGNCPIEKPRTRSCIGKYLHEVEFLSFADLEEISTNFDSMYVQALLIRERIVGVFNTYNLFFIRRVAIINANHDIKKSMMYWIFSLRIEAQQLHILAFLEIFTRTMSESLSFNAGVPNILFNDLLSIFERVLMEIKRTMKLFERINKILDRPVIVIVYMALYIVGLMCRLHSNMDKREELDFNTAVYKLVTMNPKSINGFTPLHFSCFIGFKNMGIFREPESCVQSRVVFTLLRLGASANVMDNYGNTPLHIAARDRPCSMRVFNYLLSHGAHLDQCNLKRETPLMLTNLNLNQLQHLSLKCLCAKAVKIHSIPYKGILPESLENFLNFH